MVRQNVNEPAQGAREHADTRPHVSVERPLPDRLLVIVTRRQTRAFSLSIPEAAELVAELLRQVPELTRGAR